MKKESGRLGGIGILIGILLGVGGGLLLFPKGFHGGYYGAAVLLTVVACWVMVVSSVHRPVKIAANISPLEAMRFLAGQEKVHNRKKHRKLSPISMGFANFGRDRKKSVSIAVEIHPEIESFDYSWSIVNMSRKRENSILRSVGLTGKQLCRMSVTEGMCHALFAALTVLILGLPLSMAVCGSVSKKSFAGAIVPYQFPFLQMGLFLLVLFGMEVVLSVWMVRRQKKQSLVEQMRATG